MKRKVLSVVLAAAMVFSMAACGNNDAGNEGNSGNSGSDVNTPTAAPSSDNGGGSSAEATPAPTEDPRSEGEKLAERLRRDSHGSERTYHSDCCVCRNQV